MAHLTRLSLLAFCLVLVAAGSAGARILQKHPAATTTKTAAVPSAIKRKPAAVRARKAVPLGRRAVQIAAKELGVPYRYGGSSPSGFDCSGLVAYVYGKLGVDLPHNAAAQFKYGRPVTTSQLAPGDLVFFHGLGHVGLYIGNGKIIHAPSSGRRVEVQSLGVRSGSVEGARRLVRS